MRSNKKASGMDIGFHPLEGRFVRMEPLKPEHKEEIRAAIDCEPATWSIMLVNPVGRPSRNIGRQAAARL
jgi:hypothetical protein